MSYFKAGKADTFFFDPTNLDSTRRAYDAAQATGQKVSIFSVPAMSGPWDRLPIIGHRSRKEILAELSITQDAEDVERLNNELRLIEQCFIDVGRKSPLQVAA